MLRKIIVGLVVGGLSVGEAAAADNWVWGGTNAGGGNDSGYYDDSASSDYSGYSGYDEAPSYNVSYKKKYKKYSNYKISAPSTGPSSSRGTIVFDPNHLTYAAYNSEGKLVRSGHASGGKRYCPDLKRGCKTPIGHFTIYAKGSANCKSKKFPLGRGGAPMPYCMFFHGGYALHGSYEVPNYNASHGCIRIVPSEAAWLSNNFVRPGTKLIVRPY